MRRLEAGEGSRKRAEEAGSREEVGSEEEGWTREVGELSRP